MSLSAFIDEQRKINCELRCRTDAIEEGLRKAHAVILEHAKLLDPAAFNEEAETPADENTEESGDRSQEEAPPPPVS